MGSRPNLNPFKFLWRNRETLVLALLLSAAVWVSAVFANDPNVEDLISDNVPIEMINLADNLIVIDELPEEAILRLRAPQSVWERINANPSLVQATVDFSGLSAGEHELPVNITLGVAPAQILEFSPATVTVNLEREITEEFNVELVQVGEAAPGFQVDAFTLNPAVVTISGPESRVELIERVTGNVSIAGARDDITAEIELVPVDENDRRISGVSVTPDMSEVSLQISQRGGYRDVAVRVETIGQPETGYRVTSVAVEPPTVTLYSENEDLITEIPGFVSTQTIDLTGRTEDVEVSLRLDLPEGVVRVGEVQTVLVTIGIAPIVTSLTLTVPITVVDLGIGLEADLSPDTVEVILTGPEPVIQELTPEDVIVFVSLAGFDLGSYLVEPEFEVLLERVNLDSINPDTIEVVIRIDDGIPDPDETI
ncbi:MAG: CdaR family protein, partial [Anaerolineales bacterium]